MSLALAGRWVTLLRADGIDVTVDPRVEHKGKQTKVAHQTVTITRGGTKLILWTLVTRYSSTADSYSLIHFGTPEANERALAERVTTVLVDAGATLGIYDYPERD